MRERILESPLGPEQFVTKEEVADLDQAAAPKQSALSPSLLQVEFQGEEEL